MYKPKNPIRIVTAASLFDGHDASINLMRRLLQDGGAEVIHLGHNRSVSRCRHGRSAGRCPGNLFVLLPRGTYGVFQVYERPFGWGRRRICKNLWWRWWGSLSTKKKSRYRTTVSTLFFHPDDGRKMGLEGMIGLVLEKCDFPLSAEATPTFSLSHSLQSREEIPHRLLGLALDGIDSGQSMEQIHRDILKGLDGFRSEKKPLVLGVTGTGGAGKSSLVDELVQRFLNAYDNLKIAVLCVDPSKRKTGGALLGDRIRMNSLSRKGAFMRSVASRGSGNEIAGSLPRMLDFVKNYNFDLIIAETSGIGQANVAITDFSDISLYVMTSEFGAQSPAGKNRHD